jgi:tetratricopeptide (TPR) repeat protein
MKEAEPLVETLNDPTRLGQVLLRMGQALRLRGEYEAAIHVGRRAVVLADELGEPVLRSSTRHRLGQTYFAVGDYSRAAELLRGSLDLLAPFTGTTDELGYVWGVGPYAWLGYTLAFLGRFTEAVPFAQRALQLAESGGRPGDLIVSLGARGLIHLVKGEPREAVSILERGQGLCQSWGIFDWSPTISSGLALAYARDGRLAEAISLHQRAREEEAREMQGTPTAGIVRFGETCILAGRLDEARAHAEEALGLATAAGERSSEVRALRLLGEVGAGGQPADAEQAERHFHAALALGDKLGLRPEAARCRLGLGALYARTTQPGRSEPHLAAALAMFREMEMPYWIDQAERALHALRESR